MTDLSKMSDEELRRIASGQPQSPASLSDDELRRIASGGAEPNVLEEMHPEFTTMDRLIVKNLGNDPEASARYLQKQHPSLEVKADGSGKILARGHGEKDYRVLDPDTDLLSVGTLKDLPGDIGDVLWDVGSGIGTSAATALGGLAGAAGGGGVGALPGAAAAGAASSGAIEALRQALGKGVGVNDDVKGSDVAWAAGAGAVSPLLFGTGASAQQAAKWGVKEATQRGLPGMFRDKVAPKIGEITSGVAEDTIRFAREHLPQIDALDKGKLVEYIAPKRAAVRQALDAKQDVIGKAIGEAVDSAEVLIPTSRIRQPLDDLVSALEKDQSHLDNPAMASQIAGVKETIKEIFSRRKPEESLLLDAFGQPVKQVEKLIPDDLTPAAAWRLKKQLGELARVAKLRTGEMLKGNEKLGVSSKELDAALKKAGGAVKNELNRAVDGLAPLNAQYEKAAKIRDALQPMLKSDDKMYRQVSTLSDTPNRIKRELIEDADKFLGTDMAKTSDLLTAFKNFGKAPWLAKSSQGTVSTGRIGAMAGASGALGYYLGAKTGEQGGAGLGAGIGTALGALVGGPKALRAYMQAGRFADKIGKAAEKPGVGWARPIQSIPFSAWQMMNNKEGAK